MLQSFIVRAVGSVVVTSLRSSRSRSSPPLRRASIPHATLPLIPISTTSYPRNYNGVSLDIAYRAAFPQTADLILVVIDAPTAEQSQGAAQALVHRLAGRRELFRSVQDAGNSSFFRQNGLLFQSPADVSRTMQQFTNAAPVIGGLAHDPSLRGAIDVLSGMLGNVKQGYVSLELHGAAAEPRRGDAGGCGAEPPRLVLLERASAGRRAAGAASHRSNLGRCRPHRGRTRRQGDCGRQAGRHRSQAAIGFRRHRSPHRAGSDFRRGIPQRE